jgi:hypothetical protein
MSRSEAFEELCDTLKVAVAALRDAEIPFVLGGSLAAWARGGPEPQNDLDLMLKPEDAEAALEVLQAAGMRPERPPEDWLVKAWCGEVMIDLIFRPSGLEMTDEVIERADMIPVLAVETPVMTIEDVLTTKLMALTEHSLDYTSLLSIARAVREQIQWPQLRARTTSSPYAQAFFTLVQELGIAPSLGAGPHAAGHRVRVISGGE